jgi:uncharacterized protein (DUF983 family)
MSFKPQFLLQNPTARGCLGRCPKCGEGRIFPAFLKVVDSCPACGEELHHHRADDFPAYIVIFIVGHLLVPIVLAVEAAFSPPVWVHLALWLPISLALVMGLLQPVKGAIVGVQWTFGMHGLGESQGGSRREAAAVGPEQNPVQG